MADAFDSAAWKQQANNYSRENDRIDQRDAALARLSAGVTRAEVADLFGMPDEDLGQDWVYVLAETAFGGEFDLLVVRFEGDTVARAWATSSETYTGPAS